MEDKQLKDITEEIIQKLEAPFPAEALSPIETKTYLTTIKAIYITERLNKVFGLGKWNINHEIISDTEDYVTIKGQLCAVEYGLFSPFQYGGHRKTGKGVEPADGYKSAVTDCISKCASYWGVGIDVFKGKTKANINSQPQPQKSTIKQEIKETDVPF